MLNERLAGHYGCRDTGRGNPQGEIARRLSPGRILVAGSVLKVTANGTNTSRDRGVWVMERILGKTPNPPPPNIPGWNRTFAGRVLRALW